MILINIIINTTIFLGLLYGFIPYEVGGNSSLSLLLRLIVIITLTVYLFFLSKLYKKTNIIVLLFIISFYSLLSSMVSASLYLFVFLTSILSGFVIANILRYNSYIRKRFIFSLKCLIFLSVLMLFLQIFYFTRHYYVLKLHEFFYPFSHARFEVVDYLELVRLGGLYIEPGTYSNYMYIFLIIYVFMDKKHNILLVFFAIISIIASMSAWGILCGFYFLIIYSLKILIGASMIKKILVIPILIPVVVYGIINFNVEDISESPTFIFIQNKLKMKTPSGYSKVMVFKRFKENISNYIFLGDGFASQVNSDIDSPQDAGFLVNFAIVFGIIFTFFMLILYSYSLIKLKEWFILVASFPILISKIFYWGFSFWLLFFLVVYGKRKVKKAKFI